MYPAANLGYPSNPGSVDPNYLAMLHAQQTQPVGGFGPPQTERGAPAPVWTLPTTPTSYNMPPAQDTATFSPAATSGQVSPQSNPAADAQLEQQLMQMLANAGASDAAPGGTPAAAMSAVPASKGISGHTASGTIIQRPDGGFSDTSNGNSGGITDTLFSKQGLGILGGIIAAGTLITFFWKQLIRSEKDKFAKFTKNWSEEHLEHLKTAVRNKSESKIEELREAVKGNYQDLVTRIQEKLEGDSVRKATVDSAEAAINKTHDAALEVLQQDADLDAVVKKIDEQGAETASQLAEVQTLFDQKS